MVRRLASVIVAALVAAAPAAAVLPSQLIVFGDSLVDAGNINAAFGSDFFNPVAAGYFPGRFTNGPDYTDLINQQLYGSLLTPSLLGGTNYAYGGARYVNDGDLVPDFAFQVGSYLTAAANTADPDALYIVNLGGNDVFGLQTNSLGGFADAASYTAALLDTLEDGLLALSGAGATRILVTGIPNLNATGFALEAQVQGRLDALQPQLRSTQLVRFSYLNFFQQLGANPGAFGLPPFDQAGPCIASRVPVNGVIDCAGFFSFDGIHPTAAVHVALAGEVRSLVPEPASWAMLIAGFGMVGAVMRRRRGSVAVAGAAQGPLV